MVGKLSANPLDDRAIFCRNACNGGKGTPTTCTCACRPDLGGLAGGGICGAEEQRADASGYGSHCFNLEPGRQSGASETAAAATDRVGGASGCKRFLDNFLIRTTTKKAADSSNNNNNEHNNKWHCEAGTTGEHLEKMAQKRYYVTLFCLILFIVACLLASFVISRSVGLGDLDADNDHKNSQQLQLRSGDGSQVPMEVRSVDLIDLIECDKTFAYTKWRLQVQVPKSSPIYRQQPPLLTPDSSNKQTTTLSKRLADEQQVTLPDSVPQGPDDNQNMKLQATRTSGEDLKAPKKGEDSGEGEGEEEQELDDGSRYHLTSTSQFVAKANNGTDLNNGADGQHHRRGARQVVGGVSTLQQQQDTDELVDFYDPFRAITSELGLSPSSVNRTVVDCFFVDTEKRYNQKILIEDRHRSVANTRRVPFNQMMEALKACRALTWTSLSKKRPTSLLAPASGRDQPAPTSERHQLVESSQLLPVQILDLNTPREIVKRQADKNPTIEPTIVSRSNENIILSLIQAWMPMGNAQLSEHNLKPGAIAATSSNGELKPDESRQRSTATSSVVPSVRPELPVATGTQPRGGHTAAVDQANRVSYITMGMSMVSGIVPNTLWCGLGDKAANYSELGAEYKIDSCCRAHDHCPIRLRPFASDYGIINLSMSTRSHCGCDLDFNNCLTAINTTLSNVIKSLYFRFVGLQCIDIESKQLTNQPIESILASD